MYDLLSRMKKENYEKQFAEDFKYYTEEERADMEKERFQYLKEREHNDFNFDLPWPENLYAAMLRVKDVKLADDKGVDLERELKETIIKFGGVEIMTIAFLVFKFGKTFDEVADFLSLSYNAMMSQFLKAMGSFSHPSKSKILMRYAVESIGESVLPKEEDEDE